MSIAIIICTHGSSAEQLLKTAEMILGIQNNIAWIDFIPGENTEILIKKYHSCFINLNTTIGTLFLVDTWGGTPFNAASRLACNKENYEVITGVNIPMLIEIMMTREDNPSLQELTNIALEAGRIGIKSLKTAEVIKVTHNSHTSPMIANKKGHMIISLARIDDRLIHGQVSTRWTKETNVKRIIVVSDEVASDKIRKTLLTQVAPPGVTAHVVDIAKAIRVYNNPKYANDNVMLLFTNPTDVIRIIEGGIKISSVNIGGIAYQHGKIQIDNAVSIDEKDIKAFKKLNQLGIELEIRKVPSDSSIKIMDLIKKIKK